MIASLFVFTALVSRIQAPVNLLPSDKLSNGALTNWLPTGLNKFESVAVNQHQLAGAVKATYTSKPSGMPWDISLHAISVGRLEIGHTVYLRAWMRSSTSSRISLIYERSSNPFTKPANSVFTLTPEWKEYRTAGISDGTYEPGETQLTIFLNYGTGSGSVEIGDVRAEDIGVKPITSLPITVAYYSKPPSNAWRAQALARIEKYRKGDLAVKVVDSHGKPVRGATVKVDQIQQEFRFGTAAPASLIVANNQTGENFRADLLRFFNTVTFENDLKWQTLGTPNYSEVDPALKWLLDHGFRVRGHNLVWGSFSYLPRGIAEMSNQQIVDTIHKRITDTVSRFKGKLYIWDVVNEAVSEKALWDRIGWDKFVDAYKWAREADPNVQLCYNDYNWTEEESVGVNQRIASTKLVKLLIKNGAPLDAIGLQSHEETPLTPMSRVIEIASDLAKLGKKLEVTEYDLGVVDDNFNGDYMRDFLTAMYSVPQVQSFVMWGFWQGAHWRANQGGAMVRHDWTLRPAALIWEDLTRHQWWTKLSTTTGLTGTCHTRPFYGTLRVTASSHGKTVTKEVRLRPGNPASVSLRL